MDKLSEHQAENRALLVEHLQQAATARKGIRLELDHILIRKGNKAVLYSEPGGVREVLERLSSVYGSPLFEDGMLVGLRTDATSLHLGPTGQLALSLGPFEDILELEAAYLEFRYAIDPILKELDLITPMLGYPPYAKAGDLELVPIQRYQMIDAYLSDTPHRGSCLVRASAFLRAAIDYKSEADALRKYRLAAKIAPILALICDNSPVFEGEESDASLANITARACLGQNEAGLAPGSLSPSFGFADYADYALGRKAIVVPASPCGEGLRFVGDVSFDEVYAGRCMDGREIECALTADWSDVRLTDAVEIAVADALPLEYALAYATLIRALFHNNRNLEMLDALLGEVAEEQVASAKQALSERGYGACIYGRGAQFWADLLIVLASGSITDDEASYLEPLATLVSYRQRLAGVWARIVEKRTKFPAGEPDAPVIGVVPRYDFEWAGIMMNDAYTSGLLETGAVPIVLPLTSDPGHIERLVRACDGFLIPGGQDIDPGRYDARRKMHTHRSATARDIMEDLLIRAALDAGKPLLGICRGMQSLNVSLGGTLHQDINAEHPGSPASHVQPRPWELPAHMANLVEGSKLEQVIGVSRIGVNTLHHQSIARLGEGLMVSAVSDDGVIEGIELKGEAFVLGVQWHPELMWRQRPHSKRLFAALVSAASEARLRRLEG